MRTPQEIIKELLAKKGLEKQEEIDNFLNPKLSALPHPNEMWGMEAASKVVVTALQDEIPILIWGDYDVDGTTAASLLYNFFSAIGVKKLFYHIPNRITEGYGLNVDYFKKDDWSIDSPFLLITVDCGISNYREVEEIKKRGGRVIVTDHHLLPEKLPDCTFLNPSNPQCGFNKKFLAGVGVSFYLVAGVRNYLISNNITIKHLKKIESLKYFLGFVALGTLADIVKLSDVNRLLVKAGIESLAETPFKGLKKLLESGDIYNGEMSSEDISFNIAPKINAAGRFGVGKKVVDLFTTSDEKTSKSLVKKLTKLNDDRKLQCKNALEKILLQVDSTKTKNDNCIVIIGNYFEGIIGIIASKLVDQFKVPAFVFSDVDQNGDIKGSARSVEGINILDAITANGYLLKKFGGHSMAAGMSLSFLNFDQFKENLISAFSKLTLDRAIKPIYDLESSIEEVFNPEFLKLFKLLEPFGEGNKQPIFYDSKVSIVSCRRVGFNGAHLQVTLRNKFHDNVKGIGFNLGDKFELAEPGSFAKIFFTPTINRFKNSSTWQARIVDLF